MSRVKQAEAQKERKLTLARAYQQVLKSEAGHRVLYDLMKEFHILSPAYTVGDPHHSSFQEGQRSVVLHLMQKARIDMNRMTKVLDKQIEIAMREGGNDEWTV